MAIYDAVASEYAEVFDDISLRCFEWPRLKKIISGLKPQTLLDVGCGNGYLLEALVSTVPGLYGVEPSAPMCRAARERLGKGAALYEVPAEALPFSDGFFDMAVSLLSFRYMDWERALSEIHRVLKPGGVFVLIDLFAARFNPLMFADYAAAVIKVRLQYAGNREFRKKLKTLGENPDWKKMVAENPRRELDDARQAVQKKFRILKEEAFCLSARGKTVGIVCEKK